MKLSEEVNDIKYSHLIWSVGEIMG